MKVLSLPKWIYGALAIISFGGGWLFVLPARPPEIDFQFWTLIGWYSVTIFFALIGWPSWLALVGLGLLGFSLSIYANSLIGSSQFYFVLCLLAIAGNIVMLRKNRRAFSVPLLIGLIGSAIVAGLDAFGRYTKIFDVLDAPFMWKHWWWEWLSMLGGFAMVCLPIALLLFVRRGDPPTSMSSAKYWSLIRRVVSVLLGTVVGLIILYLISEREGVMRTLQATRSAHRMPGWTQVRGKYSAPVAFSGLWMGRQELTINVRSKHPDLLDSATWRIDVTDKAGPTETWETFDHEFSQASGIIAREKWLADWKKQMRGRSVELLIKGDRSHAILKGDENRMRHVWQQFGLKGSPRFYVLARRDDSSIDLVFNEDGSFAVGEESEARKRSELSSHWLDHLRYKNWSDPGSMFLNDELAVITADGHWESRVYQRAVVEPDDENEL